MTALRLLLSAFLLAGLPCAAPVAATPPDRILVFTRTAKFRHESIPVAVATLKRIAAAEGMVADHTEDGGAFTAAHLARYRVVVFASTTGDDFPLPDKQGFVNWVASGKAFIGVHAATDTLKTFSPYVAMIGGAFRTHGPQVTVECLNQDPAHAACAGLPKRWTVFDEIYQLKDFDRSKVHGLLTLDTLLLTDPDRKAGKSTPGDYPIAWSSLHGKGRVFYTSLGHREDIWEPSHGDAASR